MSSLADRVVVVTGGASGIGLALAREFDRRGARLVLSDVDAAALNRATSHLSGARMIVRVADVTSPESMAELQDAALGAYGRVDVVCLNAGVVTTGPILATPESSWRWMLEVNVMGLVHGVATFCPRLVERGDGHVVITASAAGIMNAPGLGAYGATKHAAVGLAANLREELAPHGVGVSVLCPGVIRTPLFESSSTHPRHVEAHPDADTLELYKQLVDEAPAPEVVARAAADAVLANELFVMTGPEVGGLVMQRQRAIRSALPPRPAPVDGA
jgi:NAD(P)-dependent dehydrogenase (short-subunit alcohol dehydrogenase family)